MTSSSQSKDDDSLDRKPFVRTESPGSDGEHGMKGYTSQDSGTFSNSGKEKAGRRTSSRGGEENKNWDDQQQKTVFVDAAAMKEKVRQNLTKPKHTVLDYYKKTGPWQCIARSPFFEHLTLSVIAFNAIWIAVDTDHNDAEMLLDAHPVFQVAENMFCAFFSFEWFVRYMSFQRKRNGFKDAWFVFDTMLVTTMVLETWALNAVALFSTGGGGGGLGNASILRIARLLRLSRMARMARLLRAMPELMVLIKGMMAATRSVFFTLCLLILIMYVFAIAFTQLTDGTSLGKNHFGNVAESMYTLLVHGALLDDVGVFANELGSESFMLALIFFVFGLLAALTVMNMLIGVLCEVVSAVAATEKEETLVTYVNGKLRQVVDMLDTDGDKQISKKEFVEILENIDAARALQEVGVDVVGLIDFAEFIFQDDNMEDGEEHERELSFGNFMNVVLQLRGSNNATVKDIVDLRKFMRRALLQTNAQLVNIQRHLTGVRGSLTRPSKQVSSAQLSSTQMSSTTSSAYGTSSNHVGHVRSSSSEAYLQVKSEKVEVLNCESIGVETKPEMIHEEPLKPQNVEIATDTELVKAAGTPDSTPAGVPAALPARSFGGVEDGGYPVPPLPTPQAPLLRQRIQENERLLGVQRIGKPSARKNQHDVAAINLQGQWHSLDTNVADENLNYIMSHPSAPILARHSPPWTPMESVLEDEQCVSDAGWSDVTPSPCLLEVDQLRWQMARLGKMLSAGLNEFNRIHEGLEREMLR